jgi:hypothetical protein
MENAVDPCRHYPSQSIAASRQAFVVPLRRSRRLEGAPARAKVEVVSVAPLLTETLRRMHTGGSVVELLEP